MRRIDLVTMEMLPGVEAPVAGGGIRAWSLLRSLSAVGHEVRVCQPVELLERYGLPTANGFNTTSMQAFIDASPADLFVFEQWYPLSLAERIDRPVVVDLPGPLLLENHWRRVGSTERMVLLKLRALARADLWLYATPRQRYYWMAYLAMLGRDLSRPPLLHVPIALPPRPASPAAREPLRFAYAGIFWPWQDPTPALGALLERMEARGSGELEVYGGVHPQHEAAGQQFRDLSDALPEGERIHYRGLLPFEALCERLEAAGVAVEADAPNAERELSSTIRALVYLHCGLPLVIGREHYLAGAVEAAGAGWVVDPLDRAALLHVFDGILAQPEEALARGERARALARGSFALPDAHAVLHAALEGLAAGERTAPFTERLDANMREAEGRLLAHIEHLDQECRRQVEELARQDAHIQELYRSLHVSRQVRQALECSYAIASRDLDSLRVSRPYRLLAAARRLLGRGGKPEDHRPRLDEIDNPLD